MIYMYYTLFATFCLLISPALLAAFCSLYQTLSASHFLHHSVYFCLTHPLSNSVTSPYVSHLSPLPLPSCQMPMIHIRSVYISCCSSSFLPPSHSYLILTVSPSLSALFFSISLSFHSPPDFFFFSLLPLLIFSHCFSPSSCAS